MEFRQKVIDEPLLEFGDKQTFIDPRHGLVEFGPFSPPWATR